MSLSDQVTRNISTTWQNLPFLWWPLDLHLAGPNPRAWLRLSDSRFITFRYAVDYDERLIGKWGPFKLVRPETAEECDDREEAEAEELFLIHEMNRYTQWSY